MLPSAILKFVFFRLTPFVYCFSNQVLLESIFQSRISAHSVEKKWQWTDIKPSRDLEWHDCEDGFQCARLDVPLDWLEPTKTERVILAVIKLPAKDLADYKGPLFTNPGGPGGSGVSELRRSGRAFQKIVGDNHDLISFDPRGVGSSTALYCWPSQQSEAAWSLQDVGVIDSHPGVLYDAYARASASSNLCTSSVAGGNETSGEYGIFSHVSTTSVARDMLEILHQTGHEKLRYWGFSYGTMLGGMFAAMFPDKVERIVNDGNVDYEEWVSTSHAHFLHDTDIIMSAFYTLCHSTGPANCALWSPTPSLIEARLNTILATLKKHPVVVPASHSVVGTTNLPEFVTYSSLKRLISTSLYRPIQLFPALARVSAALEIGDGAPFLDVLNALGFTPKQLSCDIQDMPGSEESDGNDDAFRAIMCSDGEEMKDSVEQFGNYAEKIMNMSKAAGAVNVLFRIACVGWKAKARWRFAGPFEANTSYPILFIANKADNVTPLRSARNNAKGFNNSGVLIQNSYGHTSLAAPSLCTAKHLRAYFQNGTMPEPNTECEADQPFGKLKAVEGMSQDEDEIRAAMWELSETMPWIPYSVRRL